MSMDRLKELHAGGWVVELPGSSAMKAINEYDAVVAERDAALKRVAELERCILNATKEAAEFVLWMKCDLHANGRGPTGGYKARLGDAIAHHDGLSVALSVTR